MSERAWLVRDAIARVLSDAPAPPATWLAVFRRVIVVVAFFAYGLAFDNLASAILACFGAVQIGLMEVVLPFRKAAGLIVSLVLACTVAVALGMLVGGTWIAVLGIATLAYVFGCTAGLSNRAMTIGISSLALAVIFAGIPRPPAEIPSAVAWVALGMVVQGALSLVMWRTERRRFVRRALANKLHAIVMMLRHQSVDPDSLVRVHSQSDVASEDLDNAGFPPDEDRSMRTAFSATIVMSRAVIAWMVLDQPGDEERIRAGLGVTQQQRRLDRLWPRRGRPMAEVASPGVNDALASLDRAVSAVLGGPPADEPILSAAQPKPAAPVPSFWQAVRPGGAHVRDGLRMAAGVAVAEAASLLFPNAHSFWLPLTVVFVLRPTWSLTVVRGVNRTIGNLAALLLLPFIFVSVGPSSWGLVAVLAILATVTYRWFFGNYVVASFGLAGTILLLDFAENPNPDLFITRFVATILGTIVAVAAILLIPGWRRDVAPHQAHALIDALSSWRDDLRRWIRGDRELGLSTLEGELVTGRRALLNLEPTMVGVLLEPGSKGKPVPLAMLFAAGSRETAALMAVTYALLAADHHGRTLSEADRSRIVAVSNVEGAGADFDRAAREYVQA